MATIITERTKSDYQRGADRRIETVPREDKQDTHIMSDMRTMVHRGDAKGLSAYLDHSDWRVRLAAVWGLGSIGNVVVIEPLVRTWKDDTDERVRMEAMIMAKATWQRITKPFYRYN